MTELPEHLRDDGTRVPSQDFPDEELLYRSLPAGTWPPIDNARLALVVDFPTCCWRGSECEPSEMFLKFSTHTAVVGWRCGDLPDGVSVPDHRGINEVAAFVVHVPEDGVWPHCEIRVHAGDPTDFLRRDDLTKSQKLTIRDAIASAAIRTLMAERDN